MIMENEKLQESNYIFSTLPYNPLLFNENSLKKNYVKIKD